MVSDVTLKNLSHLLKEFMRLLCLGVTTGTLNTKQLRLSKASSSLLHLVSWVHVSKTHRKNMSLSNVLCLIHKEPQASECKPTITLV